MTQPSREGSGGRFFAKLRMDIPISSYAQARHCRLSTFLEPHLAGVGLQHKG